ncbi:RNA polymerase, sigma-24 subunit, RpoE, ECF subfamily [Actinobacteria bacterium OK074]|nr:RNA polymerase, sigma-24 subunit, RpoE, ECF subfamily [Actinobacteria bacterium OK074]
MTGLVPEPVDGVPPETASPAVKVPSPAAVPDEGPFTSEQVRQLEAQGFAFAMARGIGERDARFFARLARDAAVHRTPPLNLKEARGYVVRVVRNKIVDLRRGPSREVPVDRLPDRDAGDVTAEQVIRRDEIRRAMRMVQEVLTERQFEVFWLRCVMEMSGEETAQALGISPGTVAATLNRAKTKIEAHVRESKQRDERDERGERGERGARDERGTRDAREEPEEKAQPGDEWVARPRGRTRPEGGEGTVPPRRRPNDHR